MKLSSAQLKLLNKLWEDYDDVSPYENYDDFFLNGDSCQIASAYSAGWCYRELDDYKKEFPERYAKSSESFNRIKNDKVLLVRAKTETVRKLASLGYIEIVRESKYKGGYESVRLLRRA